MSSGKEGSSPLPPPQVCLSLVEEAPVGVCIVQDGDIVYLNRRLRESGGYAASDSHSREALSVIHPDDRALVTRQIRMRLSGEDSPPSFTVRFIKHDGEECEMEIFDQKFDYRGRPAVEWVVVDMTRRSAGEHALQESTARLEKSNRFHQLFGDIVSHDLMNPVWIAENYLRLVMEGGVPDGQRAFYDGMRGALAKARGILVDARTYLKAQYLGAATGEQVDLGALAEEAVNELGPALAEKGQRFTVTVADGAVVRASLMLKEAVGHLLSNAIKFGPRESEIVVVVSDGPRVRLEIRDRGPGVAVDARERIFQRFDSMEKGPVAGIGLGLAIVRRVVQLHAGLVWVEENPGGGSVFVVEFPAAD